MRFKGTKTTFVHFIGGRINLVTGSNTDTKVQLELIIYIFLYTIAGNKTQGITDKKKRLSIEILTYFEVILMFFFNVDKTFDVLRLSMVIFWKYMG